MYKRLAAIGEEGSLYYFRSHDGLEIDMLIERPQRCYPIEIKLSSTISSQQAQGIRKWMALSGDKKQTGFVVSTAKELGMVASGVRNIHYTLL